MLSSFVFERPLPPNPRERRYLPLRRRRDVDRKGNIQSDVWLNVYAVDMLASPSRDERPAIDSELESEFRELADRWYEETEDIAIIGDRFMHSTYQQIIGLGPDVVRLLLMELRKEPDYWFWA